MTTIVTRLYADHATAQKASEALQMQNHPTANISVVAAGKSAEEDLVAAGVPDSSAAAYADAMKAKNAVIVVRAPVTPFGAARNAMDTVDQFDSLDAGVENENYYIRTENRETMMLDLKVDRTHRYWASFGYERPIGRISDAFNLPTVYSGTKFFGTFFGTPLDSGRKFWGTFVGTPLDSGRKHWGTFAGSPILSGTRYFGSFLVPPIAKRR